jgi:hypothetical protein
VLRKLATRKPGERQILKIFNKKGNFIFLLIVDFIESLQEKNKITGL